MKERHDRVQSPGLWCAGRLVPVHELPDDDAVADRDPDAAGWKTAQLGRVVLEADEIAMVVFEALDESGNGRDEQDPGHQDEGRSDPYPGPDLRAILVW